MPKLPNPINRILQNHLPERSDDYWKINPDSKRGTSKSITITAVTVTGSTVITFLGGLAMTIKVMQDEYSNNLA
jgi:hypothetical protein